MEMVYISVGHDTARQDNPDRMPLEHPIENTARQQLVVIHFQSLTKQVGIWQTTH